MANNPREAGELSTLTLAAGGGSIRAAVLGGGEKGFWVRIRGGGRVLRVGNWSDSVDAVLSSKTPASPNKAPSRT